MKRPLFWDRESYEQGQYEGWAEGWRWGMTTVVEDQLKLRHGPLSKRKVVHLYSLSMEQLEKLATALFDFHGKTDLNRWFR
ncbi:MAG: DUF4351 domain-containing protein, partial [Blastocatellia bacterium]